MEDFDPIVWKLEHDYADVRRGWTTYVHSLTAPPKIVSLDDGRLVAVEPIAAGEHVRVDLESPAMAAERMTREAAAKGAE